MEFKITKAVRDAVLACEEGSYEDNGEWHDDWDCYHMVIILSRHTRKLITYDREAAYIHSCLDNAADLCRDHDDPKRRRAAPGIAKLAAEVREACNL